MCFIISHQPCLLGLKGLSCCHLICFGIQVGVQIKQQLFYVKAEENMIKAVSVFVPKEDSATILEKQHFFSCHHSVAKLKQNI